MSNTLVTKWTGDLGFETEINGHTLKMDVATGNGGHDAGPRPKPLLLAALTGCSGMDIVSILKKMQVKDYSFSMEADGMTQDEHPMVYKTITVKFRFSGEDLPEDKVVKAVNLSTQKYCAVNAMLKEAAEIIVKIFLNDKEVSQ